MPDRFYYLAIDLGVIAIPLLFSFHPRLRFDRTHKAFVIACLLTLIPFIVWDIAFTHAMYWGFNERYLTGVSLIGLPIEEWLFFVCIPYACVFVYHSMGLLPKLQQTAIWVFRSTGVLSMACVVAAIALRDQAYTGMTLLMAGVVLGWASWIKRPAWLGRAVLAYTAVIPFFLLTNGLLTGSWIPEEIVWYNVDEMLGVRLGTIPVEDLLYGFVLILLNVTLYEAYLEASGK